jgi:hypothetical protein
VQRFIDNIATSSRAMKAEATVSGSVVAKSERTRRLFHIPLTGQLLSLMQQRFPRCLPCCDVPF